MIKNIQIKNFMGIREASYDLGNINIWQGRNKINKSNTIRAIYWLLSNQLFTDNGSGRNDLKNIIPDWDNKAVAEVSATLTNDTIIAKQYYEKWTKTRGTSDYVFSGRETKYFINHAEVKEKDFLENMTLCFETNLPQIKLSNKVNLISALIDPYYLLNPVITDYKDLRTFIIALVGDVTDEEVYATDVLFNDIKPIMKQHFNDGQKARITENKKIQSLKEEIKILDAQLETITDTYDKAEYDSLTTRVKTLQDAIINYPRTDLTLEFNALNSAKQEYLESYNKDIANNINHALNDASKLVDNAQSKVDVAEENLRDLKLEINNDIDMYNKSIEKVKLEEATLKALNDKLTHEYESKYEVKGFVCEKCGYEHIDVDSLKYFEDLKEKRIKDIKDQINSCNDNIECLQLQVKTLTSDIKEKKEQLPTLEHNYNLALQELSGANEKYLEIKDMPFDPITQITKDLQVVSDNLQVKYNELVANADELRNEQIAKLKADLQPLSDNLAIITAKKLNVEKGAKIQLDLDNKNIALADAEVNHDLIVRFIKTKISMANSKTKDILGIEFKMLEEQVNGGTSEVCYPIINGIPYQPVNTSEKYVVGVKLIESIRRLLNVSNLPIFIDITDTLDDDKIYNLHQMQVLATAVTDSQEIDFKKL